jgi:hypothetical protein
MISAGNGVIVGVGVMVGIFVAVVEGTSVVVAGISVGRGDGEACGGSIV